MAPTDMTTKKIREQLPPWTPLTTRTIADLTGAPIKSIRSALNRMEAAGEIERSEVYNPRGPRHAAWCRTKDSAGEPLPKDQDHG
jgi:hypothetical protein